MSLPDPSAVKAALVAARKRYPSATVTEEQMGEILNRVAQQFPYMGMHRKNGQAKQPRTGIGVSHDVLRYLPPDDTLGWWSDVLGATGVGQATPLAPDWQRSTDGPSSFVPPVAVDDDKDDDGGNPPPAGLTEADVRRIIREELAKPRAVALKSPLGKYISEDRDHTETPDGSPALLANRQAAGPWETFTLEPK
jgi:hypothetical protein